MLDLNQIKKFLPHRFPFLLIDRIIEIEKGVRVVALKNITVNDVFTQEYFNGIYPMQGVLYVEAMAQAAAFLILDLSDEGGKMAYFSTFDKVRFRCPAVPGDQLQIEVKIVKLRSRVGKFYGRCLIGDKIASEARFSCMLSPDETSNF
ncbi:MAG TPA: 3-hydroxyacyl-ACP dehydratase FabZ [Bacillota bacterium]|nr:3-hydroxyacyl-ACP dehydratase FabZ [Bacillota bacterium]